MYTYNVTVSVDASVHEEWLEWMLGTHMPEVLATGMFADATLHEVLVDEESGPTYAAQYRFHDLADLRVMLGMQNQQTHTRHMGVDGGC